MTRSSRRAFTLIELIVVIVVLGVLAALAVPNFSSVSRGFADRKATNDAGATLRVIQAQAAFKTDGTLTDADILQAAPNVLDTGVHAHAYPGQPSAAASNNLLGLAAKSTSGRCSYQQARRSSIVQQWNVATASTSECDGHTALLGPLAPPQYTWTDTFAGGTYTAGTFNGTAVVPTTPRAILVSNYGGYNGAQTMLSRAGFTDFTINTAASTLADVAGYDIVVADDAAWSCGSTGKCGLLTQAYNAGHSVVTVANDTSAGHLPMITASVFVSGFAIAPAGTHAASRRWNAEQREADTGVCPSAVRSTTIVFATMRHPNGTTECKMAFGEDQPSTGGRWVHVTPYAHAAGPGTSYSRMFTQMVRWGRPVTRTTPPIPLDAVATITSARVVFDADLPHGADIYVESSVDAGATWQSVDGAGRIPALAGVAGAGRSVQLRARMSTIDPQSPSSLRTLRLEVR